ncbi:MAG: arginine--tRNA ligase [Candidatus Pacearchaeota archaeon]|nr:arginine--tRNA ligase [Candidatus Pacearchaeota archaeon]
MDFEEKIKEAIVKAVGPANIKKEEVFLEKPKENFGDYAFPCFPLAKIFKKNPHDIARELIEKMEKDLKKTPEIEKVEAVAGYLNFFIDKEKLIGTTLNSLSKKIPAKKGMKEKKETILVESPGPNTNKPLHVGHLRNLFIGDSIARIFQFFGNKVVRVDVINDRGIHVCKSMLAYQKWGDNKTPEQAKRKSDHFVGDFYVLFSQKSKQNPKLEEEAQEMLKKWEQGDKETIDLWKKMNKWAIDGMKQTYALLNFKHDRQYFESETYKQGKEIVLNGVKKGIFKKNEDSSVGIDLGGELGEKILLRQDGTTVYITQDLYMAKKRYEDYKFNKMFYVVASEQNYHFKVLFKILDILGYKWSKECFHISYGMVNLPSGKMKSREGTIIDADDLIREIKEDSKQELKKRYPELNEKDLDSRSLAIALSAIKFALLKVDLKKDILFNKEEALDFEGFSGPYLQYSYARARSILSKLKKSKVTSRSSFKDLDEQEIIFVKKLADFSNTAERAKNEIKPDLIALYAYELAQIFNNFYHNCPVIKAEKTEQARRIEMIHSFSKTMKNCLDMLGIVALEEM